MKLIESNSETVTVQMALEEFHALRDAATEAIDSLLRVIKGLKDDLLTDEFEEEDLKEDIERAEKLLARVRAVSQELEQITTDNDLARSF